MNYSREFVFKVIEYWANSKFKCGQMPTDLIGVVRKLEVRQQRMDELLVKKLEKKRRTSERKRQEIELKKELRKQKIIQKQFEESLKLPSTGRAEYVYVIKVTGKLNFTGYGRTTNLRNRKSSYDKSLSYQDSIIEEFFYIQLPDKGGKYIEKAVKHAYTVSPQPVNGFVSEATDQKFEDVVTFVKECVHQRNILAQTLL